MLDPSCPWMVSWWLLNHSEPAKKLFAKMLLYLAKQVSKKDNFLLLYFHALFLIVFFFKNCIPHQRTYSMMTFVLIGSVLFWVESLRRIEWSAGVEIEYCSQLTKNIWRWLFHQLPVGQKKWFCRPPAMSFGFLDVIFGGKGLEIDTYKPPNFIW